MERKHVMWAVFAALAVLMVIVILWGLRASRSPAADLASEVTVRFDDTGEDLKMTRGQIERALIARIFQPGPIDPAVGLTNPKTGKPTGFPADREYWNRLIEEAKKAADQNKKK